MTEQDTTTTQPAADVHAYVGGRCGSCGVVRRDEDLYGPSECPDPLLRRPELPQPVSVVTVAEYILAAGGEMETSKLQSLVYLCQAWHLAATGLPLFREPIEAWAEGPIVPVLHALLDGHETVAPGFFREAIRAHGGELPMPAALSPTTEH
jgi:hypothetical protein